MITWAARELLAAVIEQAVWDRRLAVTRGLVDEKANQVKPPASAKQVRVDKAEEIVGGLNYFFEEGGLETIVKFADFNLNISLIKKKSKERYEDE